MTHDELRAIIKRGVANPENLTTQMMEELEKWIDSLDETVRDEAVLSEIPNSFDEVKDFSALDYSIPYNRAYLRAVLLHHFLIDDPRFTRYEMVPGIAINVFHDLETDFYVDLPMSLVRGTPDRWEPITCIKNLRGQGANRTLIHSIKNPFWSRTGQTAVRMTTMEFVEAYIEHPDFGQIVEAKIPLITQRFKDQIKKQINADRDYVKVILIPTMMRFLIDCFERGTGYRRACAYAAIDLIPADDPAHQQLAETADLIDGIKLTAHNLEFAQKNLSRFFMLLEGVPFGLCRSFIRDELFQIIHQKIEQEPGNQQLRQQAFNFIYSHKDSFRLTKVTFDLLYKILQEVSDNTSSADVTFLRCCSFQRVDKTAIPVLISIVQSHKDLESIMNACHPENWGPLLVSLGILGPDDNRLFDDIFSHDILDLRLTTNQNRLERILFAYDSQSSTYHRLSRLVQMNSYEPEFVHQLRHFCKNHVIKDEEVPEIKKLFAKHFGDIYKKQILGQDVSNDPVVAAIKKPSRDSH